MFWNDYRIEFTRLTQGVGVIPMESINAIEPGLSHAVDAAIDHLGRDLMGREYDREIEDDPDDCDRVIVWTSKDRRDIIIAKIHADGPDAWIPWDVCVDCIDAMFGLSDAGPSARDRLADELRDDTSVLMPECDPHFSWDSCDSCGSHLGGSRATVLTPRKGD